MYKINFNQPLHIHFIGIGGISMSGLAEILLEEHFTISGSDTKESGLTRHLEHMGARIFYGQKAENLSDDIDLIVYTAAQRFRASRGSGAAGFCCQLADQGHGRCSGPLHRAASQC